MNFNQDLQRLINFGFNPQLSYLALQQAGGNINFALNMLISMAQEKPPPPPPKSKISGLLKCQICLDDLKDEKNCELNSFYDHKEEKNCSHKFCNECLEKFLYNNFYHKKRSFLTIRCPFEKCRSICSLDLVKSHCIEKNKECKELYEKLIKDLPQIPKIDEKERTVSNDIKGYYELKDFGYHFTKDKEELRHIKTGEKFFFINERHYIAIGEAMIRYIQDKMKKECQLEEVFLDSTKINNVFFSKDAFTNPNKLMVIIQGSGPVRAGMWARSLCFNDSLHTGTCIPYIKRAQKEGYGVAVLNPNLNSYLEKQYQESFKKRYNWTDPLKPRRHEKFKCKYIENSESPGEHTLHVFDEYIFKKAKAKDIYIVAHSAGGWCTCKLVTKRKKQCFDKIRAVAFTDSVHSILDEDPDHLKEFIREKAINWGTSKKPLDTLIEPKSEQSCKVLSCGSTSHEMSSSSCFPSVFKYFQKVEQDLKKE